jgi:hypothetical protein
MGLIGRIVIVAGATVAAAGVTLITVPGGLIFSGLILVAYATIFLLDF